MVDSQMRSALMGRGVVVGDVDHSRVDGRRGEEDDGNTRKKKIWVPVSLSGERR